MIVSGSPSSVGARFGFVFFRLPVSRLLGAPFGLFVCFHGLGAFALYAVMGIIRGPWRHHVFFRINGKKTAKTVVFAAF